MKDFIRLTKEAWRFYLTAFGIALTFVVSNNVYLISQCKKEAATRNTILDMGYIFYNKVDGYDLINFWIALAGIVLFLFVRYFSFVDKRTMEFQMLWPVKKRMLVIHDYVCSAAILVVMWLVTMVSFFVTQEAHNQTVTGKNVLLREAAEQADRQLWEYGGFYLFYLLLMFSLLYLGIIICRNGIVGMMVMGLCWGIVNFFVDVFSYDGLYNLVDPKYFFDCLQRDTEVKRRELIILAVVLLLIDVLIVIAAQRRELSRGKWFYFSWIDYFCIALSGVSLVVILLFGFLMTPWIDLLVGISVSGGLLYLRGRDDGKADRWEVK